MNHSSLGRQHSAFKSHAFSPYTEAEAGLGEVGREQLAGEGTGLTLEIDGAARARLWSRALPVPCPAARFLPHYSFLNTHIGGTLFTLDSIWDSYPNMNTLP